MNDCYLNEYGYVDSTPLRQVIGKVTIFRVLNAEYFVGFNIAAFACDNNLDKISQLVLWDETRISDESVVWLSQSFFINMSG